MPSLIQVASYFAYQFLFLTFGGTKPTIWEVRLNGHRHTRVNNIQQSMDYHPPICMVVTHEVSVCLL